VNLFVQHTASGESRGMKRSTRMAITVGVVIFLSLVSSVSFAAWTASSSKSATVSVGKVAVTTGTAGGANTISALGPHIYSPVSSPVSKPITVRNTGSVAATVSSITIVRTGDLGDNQVSVKLWASASSACVASATSVTQPLNNNTSINLSSLNMTIPASGSAILCASTTFTGDLVTQAGRSINVEFRLNASAGTQWTTTDSLSAAARSFTQTIIINITPNAPTMLQCVDQEDKSIISISWSTPSGFIAPNGGYNVYLDGVYLGNTTTTSTLVANRANTGITAILTSDENSASGGNTGNLTVRAVSATGTESANSAPIPIYPRNGNSGLSCAL